MHNSDDALSDDSTELSLQFTNCGRVRQQTTGSGRAQPQDSATASRPEALDIASSYYAFTYKQTTGTLLSTRLAAMQRSMEWLDVGLLPAADMSRLISSLAESASHIRDKERISIPLDDHFRESDEEMLEFLTVPYVDLDPEDAEDHPQLRDHHQIRQSSHGHLRHNSRRGPSSQSNVLTRPPPIFRRASSMVLSQRELVHNAPPPLPPAEYSEHRMPEGIPTPLQHAPSKQEVSSAVFTTTDTYPYPIKTLNDIACIVSGSSLQDALSRGFLEFVCPSMAKYIMEKLEDPEVAKSKTKLSGELVELNSHLMSLWVAQPDKGMLIWVVEEVPSIRIPLQTPPGSPPTGALSGIYRVDDGPNQNVVLQGEHFRWSPQAIGAAVILDAESLLIREYNESALNKMVGLTDNLRGRPFSELVPQFDEFWPAIEEFCKVPGVVIPEHKFRQLAGIPLGSPEFTSPNPSRHPEHSVRAVAQASEETRTELSTPRVTYIDMQLRVYTQNVLVAWLGYSHSSAPTTTDLISKIFSVVAGPNTPRQSPLSTPRATPQAVTPGHGDGSGEASSLEGGKARSESPLGTTSFEDYSELLSQVQVGAQRRTLQFKDFKELKLLGRGAYGEVRLVVTPTGDKVVLKSIFKDRILVDTWSRDRALGTIPNEIRILNQLRPLRHPNIAEMIDFFEDPKCYHVEMVPYGGPNAMDLFDFIETKSENMSPEYLLNIWRQVVSGVAQIHSLGITHRDIKDENVVMDNNGIAKLIDFGGAAYINQGPFDVFVGTIDYAAPEIVQGEQYEGCPQDAWALGILLYIIMFQEPPFKGADEIIQANLPENIPCLGSQYIRKLLVKNPADRPTVQEILDELIG